MSNRATSDEFILKPASVEMNREAAGKLESVLKNVAPRRPEGAQNEGDDVSEDVPMPPKDDSEVASEMTLQGVSGYDEDAPNYEELEVMLGGGKHSTEDAAENNDLRVLFQVLLQVWHLETYHEPMFRRPEWRVVGGADRGGILVRSSQELSSPKLCRRLAFGSLVGEVTGVFAISGFSGRFFFESFNMFCWE